MSTQAVYFGYGSNIWLDQMARRCPQSKFIGIGSLADWKWIINIRGYATIIPSKGDVVYGLMYELTADDERKLDGYEGVPESYIKEILPIEFARGGKDGSLIEGKKVIDALVYVDVARTTESKPKTEYIYRMNMAIVDGIEMGIPQEYFEKYLRPFIPVTEKN